LAAELERVTKESIDRRKALAEAKARAEKLEAELAEIRKSLPPPEELEALRRAKAEHEAKMEAEKTALQRVQDAAAKKQEELNAALADRERKIAELTERRNTDRIRSLIASEFPKHTSFPVADLMATITAGLIVDPETDEIIVIEPGNTKQEAIDPDTGKPMKPEAYIAKFVAARPHIAAVRPAQGSGAPASGIRRVGQSGPQSVEDIARMTKAEFDEFLKSGGSPPNNGATKRTAPPVAT
jgi:hypothetical protein